MSHLNTLNYFSCAMRLSLLSQIIVGLQIYFLIQFNSSIIFGEFFMFRKWTSSITYLLSLLEHVFDFRSMFLFVKSVLNWSLRNAKCCMPSDTKCRDISCKLKLKVCTKLVSQHMYLLYSTTDSQEFICILQLAKCWLGKIKIVSNKKYS